MLICFGQYSLQRRQPVPRPVNFLFDLTNLKNGNRHNLRNLLAYRDSIVNMQDFFFVGIISAIALGVVLIKGILFVIHVVNLKTSNDIIRRNQAHNKSVNVRLNAQQTQSATMSSIENVVNWKVEDPRFVDDLRQQFLAKTKTRRTPTSERTASPRERVPLATTDFGEPYDDELDDPVPIYTYNPSIGGTQV